MMKAVLLVSLLFITGWWNNLTSISRTNQLKQEAEIAFRNKNYEKAAAAWLRVLEEEKNDAVRLNLAHAYYLQGKTLPAAREYQQLIRTAPEKLKSVAQLQLGNQLAKTGDYESAINLYREALKSDPKNQPARYNYELLLKQHEQENKPEEPEISPEQNKENQQQNQQQASPQPSGEPKNEGNNGQNQKEGGQEQEINRGDSEGKDAGENNSEERNVDTPERTPGNPGNMPGEATTTQKLQQINMPAERARMLLNALRDAEKQYLQQLPRKENARKKKGMPGW